MNHDSLKSQLNELQVPPFCQNASDKAWHRARIAFLNSSTHENKKTQSTIMTFALPWLSGAFAIVLTAFLCFNTITKDSSELESLQLLSEMESEFQGQLKAVILQRGKIDIQLNDVSPAPRDQRIWAKVGKGKEAVELLTYSGENITLTVNGRQYNFEFYQTIDNQVLILGNDFVCLGSPRQSQFNIPCRARLISQAL